MSQWTDFPGAWTFLTSCFCCCNFWISTIWIILSLDSSQKQASRVPCYVFCTCLLTTNRNPNKLSWVFNQQEARWENILSVGRSHSTPQQSFQCPHIFFFIYYPFDWDGKDNFLMGSPFFLIILIRMAMVILIRLLLSILIWKMEIVSLKSRSEQRSLTFSTKVLVGCEMCFWQSADRYFVWIWLSTTSVKGDQNRADK